MSGTGPAELAPIAYDAYGTAVGGLNYMGLPMPPWDELPTKIRDGWIAAINAALQATTTTGDDHPSPTKAKRGQPSG